MEPIQIQTALNNDPLLHIEEKTNQIYATIKLQATIPIQQFQTILNAVQEQKDGLFTTTLQPPQK